MGMRGTVVASLMLPLLAAVAGLHALSPAEAASPTPATTTPTATPPKSTPEATPPLPPADQPMQVVGTGWIDARPSGEDVHAFIGAVDCGSSSGRIWTGGPFFILNIPAASQRPGCGVAGVTITFTVGGRAASTTLTWQAGAAVSTQIVAGPPFALYYGRYPVLETLAGPANLVPLIDDKVCGVELGGGPGPSDGVASFDVVVDPDELTPGCGRPAATVHFVLRSGDVVVATAAETAVWQPGVIQELQLTFTLAPVLPATGVGASTAGPPRECVALVLACIGIACIVAGARSRRRSVGEASADGRAPASRSA